MKRLVLGSLLSCILVGQSFGFDSQSCLHFFKKTADAVFSKKFFKGAGLGCLGAATGSLLGTYNAVEQPLFRIPDRKAAEWGALLSAAIIGPACYIAKKKEYSPEFIAGIAAGGLFTSVAAWLLIRSQIDNKRHKTK